MIAAVPYMIVFRFVHILCGVLWVGSAFLFGVFIGPAAGELGPAAGPVMGNLVLKRKVATVILILAALTVIGGGFVYWHDWHLYPSFGDWISSTFGKLITGGAILTLIAFFEGWHGVGRRVTRMALLGREMASAGGPPTPEQGAEMAGLQAKVKFASQFDLVLLFFAVFAMSTARYW